MFNSGSTTNARVLIVDDEVKICASLVEGMELEGWQALSASNGAEALEMCRRHRFHVIVMDWMLPDVDGVDWVRLIRGRGLLTPVLMLTARGSVADRLAGFDSGADDYLVKPFALAEVVARCRALLRRQSRDSSSVLRCGDLQLDFHQRVVRRGEEEIPLTPREVDVLEFLLRQQDQTVSREMLANQVWHAPTYTAALGNAINIHVTRLRQKIEPAGGPRLILTQHGVGYCLTSGGNRNFPRADGAREPSVPAAIIE